MKKEIMRFALFALLAATACGIVYVCWHFFGIMPSYRWWDVLFLALLISGIILVLLELKKRALPKAAPILFIIGIVFASCFLLPAPSDIFDNIFSALIIYLLTCAISALVVAIYMAFACRGDTIWRAIRRSLVELVWYMGLVWFVMAITVSINIGALNALQSFLPFFMISAFFVGVGMIFFIAFRCLIRLAKLIF